MAARSNIEITIKAINETKQAFAELNRDVKQCVDTVVQENKKTQASMKNIATSMSGVVTAGFAIYSMYESVERQQLMVHRMTNSLEDAQRRQKSTLEKLNEAITEHGENSEDATKAQEAYDAACKDVELAQERLTYAQNNLNEAIVRTATFVIPSVITLLDQGKKAYTTLKGTIDGATASQWAFNAAVNAVPIAIIGTLFAVAAKGSIDYQRDLASLSKEQQEYFDDLKKYMPETEHFGSAMYQTLIDKAKQWNDELKVVPPYLTKIDQTIQETIPGGTDAFQEMMNAVMMANRQIEYSTEETMKTVSELIREGLLEDAQGDIQEYVECAGGKHAKMIEDVKADIKDLEAKQKENTDKMELVTAENFEAMARDWLEHGELTETAIGMTAGEIQKMEQLFADNEGWLKDFVDLTEKEKQREVEAWKTSTEKIIEQIKQLIEWLEELKEAQDAVGIEGGGGGAGGGEEFSAASYIPSGVGLGEIPEGTYLLEKHSPGMIAPITIPGGYGGERGGGGRGGYGGGGISGFGGTPSPPSPVYIAPRTEVTVNISGPVQPVVIPTLARETKKAAYEGVSEALRDELRRKGIPIWTGE